MPGGVVFFEKPNDGTLGTLGTFSQSRYREFLGGDTYMKRLLLIGFAACTLALAPTLSVSAMPAATPQVLGKSDAAIIQVKGGHGHMGRGGRGHHYGWSRGRHRGWR
jgi:hypothetical protein